MVLGKGPITPSAEDARGHKTADAGGPSVEDKQISAARKTGVRDSGVARTV
jgi:hypothetical protein